MKPDSIPEIEFLQFARAVAMSRGNLSELNTLCAGARMMPRVPEIAKAAVAAGTTSDPAWAALHDYQVIAAGFVASLRSIGVFDGLFTSMRRVPLRTRIVVSSTAYTGTVLTEGSAQAVGNLSLLSPGMLEPKRATAMIVITNELLRAADQSLFRDELRAGVIAATDAAFIGGMVDGFTPSVVASGATADALLADLRAAASLMHINNRTKLFLIADPNTVMRLSLLSANGVRALPDLTVSGGDVGGITVIPSDQIDVDSGGTSTALLIDAQQIAAADETIVLDSSQEALVELNTAPAGGSGATLHSLWQENLIGLIAHRWFGFQRLAATACAKITGASYGEA